jgi:hypothetical protein
VSRQLMMFTIVLFPDVITKIVRFTEWFVSGKAVEA